MSSPYATGGTIIQGTYDGDAGYLHVFDVVGGDVFTPLYILDLTVVTIGGGGAGGDSDGAINYSTSGGGGGAGGYGIQVFPATDPANIPSFSITVGAGGLSSSSAGSSVFEADSIPVETLMVAGGGGAGGNGGDGLNGIVPTSATHNFSGCGGGAGSQENAGTISHDGGLGYTRGGDSANNPGSPPYTAGGGGGYGSKGDDSNDGGIGGDGINNPFASFVAYPKVSAGGGGGEEIATAGNGGDGGGGNGGNTVMATSGTSWGSGGGGGYGVFITPGNGFNGAVLIFYPTPVQADPVTDLTIIDTLWYEQTIQWTPPASFTSYEVYVTDDPANYGTAIPVAGTETTFTANTDTVGFTYFPDTVYYFRVVVLLTGTPNSNPQDTLGATDVPPPAENFEVSANNPTSQLLEWEISPLAPPLFQPDSWDFYSTEDPMDYGTPTSLPGHTVDLIQNGLTPGTHYYYRIIAKYVLDSITFSSPASDTDATTPSTPPTPAGLYYKPLQIRSAVGRGSDNYPGRHPGRGLPATQTLWMSSL
jgi:hypothetical protein